jgi:sulfoxide reductase heme-binding subunit YedZ
MTAQTGDRDQTRRRFSGPWGWRARHLVVIAAAALMLWLFAELRGQWSPMHKWNRAFADVSVVLVAVAMAIGPLARLWRPASAATPWRRELGIWSVMAAAVHTGFILVGWIRWEWPRLFGFEFHPALGEYVMFDKGFAFGNIIGIAALFYGAVLALTSNDLSQRLLGLPVWKFIQQSAYVLWALVVAHTAYFLFVHFLDFHRQTPEPNALQWPFVALVAAVATLQLAASWRTWRQRRARAGGDRALSGDQVSA